MVPHFQTGQEVQLHMEVSIPRTACDTALRMQLPSPSMYTGVNLSNIAGWVCLNKRYCLATYLILTCHLRALWTCLVVLATLDDVVLASVSDFKLHSLLKIWYFTNGLCNLQPWCILLLFVVDISDVSFEAMMVFPLGAWEAFARQNVHRRLLLPCGDPSKFFCRPGWTGILYLDCTGELSAPRSRGVPQHMWMDSYHHQKKMQAKRDWAI